MCRDLKHEMFGRDSKGIPEQQTCTDKKKKKRLLHLVVHTTVATHCQLMACHIINTNKKTKKKTWNNRWQTPTAPTVNAPSICAD